MTIKDVVAGEYHAYYHRYLEKLDSQLSLHESFEKGLKDVMAFFSGLSADTLEYRYAPDKWSCKEVLQHLIDTERIFSYRCFRIARGDKTDLAGFDQNDYVAPSRADQKSLETLLEEFEIGRRASISLLKSLNDTDLQCVGTANGGPMSARVAAFIIPAHEIWHMEIIREKYL